MTRPNALFVPSHVSRTGYGSAYGQDYGKNVFEAVGDWFTSDSIDYSYEKLWMLPMSKRDASLVGIVSYQDSMVQVALGAKPGTDSLERLDNRATIKGGLQALYLAGFIEQDPSGLIVGATNNEQDEIALLKAAGVSTKGDRGKNIAKAAQKIRKEVKAKGGKPLMRAAWALRALVMLSAAGIFGVVRGSSALVLGVIPAGVTQVAGGIVAGLSAVTQGRIDGQVQKFTAAAEKNLAVFAKKQEEKQAKEAAKVAQAELDAAQKQKADALQASVGGEGFFGVPWWGWAVGGVVLAGTVYIIRIRR